MRNGALQLIAQPTSTQGINAKTSGLTYYSCRSGMVTTNPGFNFEYGYIEVQAKIPTGMGLWPALWLAASNFKWPPEVDILEHWKTKTQTRTGAFLHPIGSVQITHTYKIRNLSNGWHTFALLWTPTALSWYVDGVHVFTTNTGIPHQKMYFIANVADKLVDEPGDCSGTMSVRYVKVWQPAT
jgi:beta-glucanase (GH16 family)